MANTINGNNKEKKKEKFETKQQPIPNSCIELHVACIRMELNNNYFDIVVVHFIFLLLFALTAARNGVRVPYNKYINILVSFG